MFTRDRYIIWKRETGHSLVSAPVVTSNLVITAGREQSSLMAVGYLDAWDRLTGEHQWSFSGEAETGLDGGVSGVPVVSGDRLYFADGRGILRCLDLESGREMWRYEPEEPVHTGQAIASDQVLLAGDDGNLSAFDLATGTKRWTFHTEDVINATPAVLNGHIVVASWDGILHSVTAEGVLAWSADLSPARPTRILAQADRIWLCDAAGSDIRMIAVTPQAETMMFTERWRLHTGNAADLNPLLLSNNVYWVDGDRHSVTCVEAATGVTQWIKVTGRSPLAAVVFGKLLIVASQDGQLLALDPRSGQTPWQLTTSIPFNSAPTVADGVVFIGGKDQAIYAVRPEEGDAPVPA